MGARHHRNNDVGELPDTAILVTRFMTADGVGEVHDFMPVTGSAPTAGTGWCGTYAVSRFTPFRRMPSPVRRCEINGVGEKA